MRVLFTHSYFLRFDEKQWKLMQPYAPLGTIYAAACLRDAGFEIALHDVMFKSGPEEIEPVLEQFQPEVLVIYDDGFNYLTKMCLTNMREAAFKMIQSAKQRGCEVIVCSSDSTDHFDTYLANGADYIVLGEGEASLMELALHLREGKVDAQSISGLAFIKNDAPLKTSPRAVLSDLDNLPLPAWDLVNMDDYRNAWMQSTGYFSINMTTTRGCPYKCNWCAKPIYGNRYHARSPKNVVGELVFLKEKYQFDHIWFCDDIFGLKPGWVREFAKLVHAAELKIRFKIQARADLLVKDEQVDALADAGCETVWMGAESGSQKILDAMDKGITIAQIEEAVRQLKSRGIHPALFLQFGYLHETIEDIELTLKMLRRVMPDEIGVSVSYPLPGTRFYEKVRAELKEKANWTDSDEMAMMFHGTYEPEFYKRLHRYVHTYYRRLRNEQAIRRRDWRAILKEPYYVLDDLRQKRILNR
jgi:radical SAM superfamily enzyme YgiQ (UPF0313 family)